MLELETKLDAPVLRGIDEVTGTVDEESVLVALLYRTSVIELLADDTPVLMATGETV